MSASHKTRALYASYSHYAGHHAGGGGGVLLTHAVACHHKVLLYVLHLLFCVEYPCVVLLLITCDAVFS